jgi:hypothetical protein
MMQLVANRFDGPNWATSQDRCIAMGISASDAGPKEGDPRRPQVRSSRGRKLVVDCRLANLPRGAAFSNRRVGKLVSLNGGGERKTNGGASAPPFCLRGRKNVLSRHWRE